MIGLIALLLAGLSVACLVALGLILFWALREHPEDGSPGTVRGIFRRWATHKPKLLAYRRDKQGRFRKVWRG